MITVTLPGPSGTPIPLAAWGTPMTQNVNEFVDLLTEPSSAWTAFTPTWRSSGTQPVLGNGTLTGRYMQFGKVGFANVVLTTGGTTTYGTGTYTWDLPPGWTAAGASRTLIGDARLSDTSVPLHYIGSAEVAASMTAVAVITHGAAGDAGATVPFTFASGDIVRICYALELV